jgi:glycolate oxidase
MQMPAPDESILARRAEIAAALREIIGDDYVMDDVASLKTYETDGLSAYRQLPLLVALPGDTGEVSRLLAYCAQAGVKVVPRGAGTGLSGGALPLVDGITIGLGRLNRILEIDYANRSAVVQPGVANLAISQAMDAAGFYYAPDPSSQIVCSIGGNVAENSGGVHSLKYGLTTNNLLGVEMVMMGGEVIRIGGKQFDSEGYDLLGVITGSEGMLGVITEVTVRILPKPPVAQALLMSFASNNSAGGVRCRYHRRRHHPGRLGADGQAGDQSRRGILSCGLSARR